MPFSKISILAALATFASRAVAQYEIVADGVHSLAPVGRAIHVLNATTTAHSSSSAGHTSVDGSKINITLTSSPLIISTSAHASKSHTIVSLEASAAAKISTSWLHFPNSTSTRRSIHTVRTSHRSIPIITMARSNFTITPPKSIRTSSRVTISLHHSSETKSFPLLSSTTVPKPVSSGHANPRTNITISAIKSKIETSVQVFTILPHSTAARSIPVAGSATARAKSISSDHAIPKSNTTIGAIKSEISTSVDFSTTITHSAEGPHSTAAKSDAFSSSATAKPASISPGHATPSSYTTIGAIKSTIATSIHFSTIVPHSTAVRSSSVASSSAARPKSISSGHSASGSTVTIGARTTTGATSIHISTGIPHSAATKSVLAASTATAAPASSSSSHALPPAGTTLRDLLAWIEAFSSKFRGKPFTDSTLARRHVRDFRRA